jgi:hypothetical protein
MKNKIVTMIEVSRKSHVIPFCLLLTSIVVQNCGGQKICSLKSTWQIKEGRLFENYEAAVRYTTNRIRFDNDSVELASGFFYNTMGWDDDYPNGRYPFVYYGNKAKYKIENDTLLVFSKPYNNWSRFAIECVNDSTLKLYGTDTLLLVKVDNAIKNKECNIKTIKARVYKGPLDLFNVGYKVSFSPNDVMLYEEQDSTSENFKRQTFKLKPGTFNEICNGFKHVDVSSLKSVYPAGESDYHVVAIDLEFVNGKTQRVEIQVSAGNNVPDELRFALIPVLYLHQSYVYPKLTAKRFSDK